MINALKYVKMMEESGFSREQAETAIGVLTDVMDEKLATKKDLELLEIRTQKSIDDLKHHMDLNVAALHTKISDLKTDLTVRLGSMMVACLAVFAAVIKLS